MPLNDGWAEVWCTAGPMVKLGHAYVGKWQWWRKGPAKVLPHMAEVISAIQTQNGALKNATPMFWNIPSRVVWVSEAANMPAPPVTYNPAVTFGFKRCMDVYRHNFFVTPRNSMIFGCKRIYASRAMQCCAQIGKNKFSRGVKTRLQCIYLRAMTPHDIMTR